MSIPLFGRWYIRDVRVIGKNQSVINISIPGVNQRDRVHVRLNLLDMIRGMTVEVKTERVMNKWKKICKRKNTELDHADIKTKSLRVHL